MAKISVRHCIAQAYGLVFGQPLTVIGLTWLPALFYAVAADFLIGRMHQAMAVAVPSAGGILGQYALFYFALLVVATALFGSVIAVPLTRHTFGLREEHVAVHLVVGARELRLFLALIRYYALSIATLLAFAIAAGVAISQGTRYAADHAMALDWLGVPFQTWLNSGAATAAILLVLYFAVRFGFLLDAVAAVEDRAGLARVRTLSRGNFWRIATILAITTVPAGLVWVACAMTFGGLTLGNAAVAVTTADTAVFAGILAAALVVLHGLLAGASAAAYSEMAEAAAQESEPLERNGYHIQQPAMAFADAGAVHGELPVHAEPYAAETAPPAAAEPHAMEIATPEAEGATAAESATTIAWMPPPPDAHFGSDPHDAVAHEAAPPDEPLAEAVAAGEGAAHPVEAQNTLQDTVPSSEEAPAEPDAQQPSIHPDIHDATAEAQQALEQQAGHIPDHAHNAEFPIPPMPPAHADANVVQSGFHSPG